MGHEKVGIAYTKKLTDILLFGLNFLPETQDRLVKSEAFPQSRCLENGS